LRRGELACHCLLVDTGRELALVDTGLGTRDVADPRARLSHFFLMLVHPDFREDLTAIRQVEKLGYNPRDVRHIVLTHLDFDHAGGLDDFPHATVHMLGAESSNAAARRTWLDRQRFRPQQWNHQSQWRVYPTGGGTRWFGFERVRPLGLSEDIALVPLIGHTFGHAGVAIRRGERWLLQAGDAYFFHREMDPERPYCTPGLRFYQWMMEKDRPARLENQARLRELASSHGNEVDVICGHDPVEFERCAGRTLKAPAQRVVERRARPRLVGVG
jgi:glyoxylase-like metal-dependent hydrolase (beta-lactamase superfamily II)